MQVHTPIKPHLQIVRRPEVLNRFGIGNTCLHKRILKGLMPPSISLGDRAVGWLKHELDAVLAAMVRGDQEDSLRMLVDCLVEQRQQLGPLYQK